MNEAIENAENRIIENDEPLAIGESEDGPSVMQTIEYGCGSDHAFTTRENCTTEIERLDDKDGKPQYEARIHVEDGSENDRVFATYNEAVAYLDDLSESENDDDDEYTAIAGYEDVEIISVGGSYQCGGCGAFKSSRQAVVDHDAKVVEYGEFRVDHCCGQSAIQDRARGLRKSTDFSDLTPEQAEELDITIDDVIDAVLEYDGDGWTLLADVDLSRLDDVDDDDDWTDAIETAWDDVEPPTKADEGKQRGFIREDEAWTPVAVAELYGETIVCRIDADDVAEVA